MEGAGLVTLRTLMVEIYVEIPTLRSLQFLSKNCALLFERLSKTDRVLFLLLNWDIRCIVSLVSDRCTSSRFQSRFWSLDVHVRKTIKGRGNVEECYEID